jgi:hypothetical protein
MAVVMISTQEWKRRIAGHAGLRKRKIQIDSDEDAFRLYSSWVLFA